MFKRVLLLAILVLTFWAGTHPVGATAAIGSVYVDTAYTGSEDGTKEKPYNTLQEGIAMAQSLSGGAWVYVKQSDGSWLQYRYIAPAKPGATGLPLTSTLLYALLAVLALGLLLMGWQFRRKAQQAIN